MTPPYVVGVSCHLQTTCQNERPTTVSRPTKQQVHEWCEDLRRTNWRDLERRLIVALDRDAVGSTLPDGYSQGQDGPAVMASRGQSRTEAAALARLSPRRREADPFRDHLEQAVRHLEASKASAQATVNRLAQLDSLTGEAPIVATRCETCASAGLTRDPDHYGNLGGALPRNMHLCSDCYKVTHRRASDPLLRANPLPTAEEVAHHDLTGRWVRRAMAARN